MDVRLIASRFAAVAAIVAAFWTMTACTVIRYVDNNDNGGDPIPPKVVDVLVMADLQRGTANLSQDYANIVGLLFFGLAENNITVRKAGLAPLYSQSEGVVPIVWGDQDPNSEFPDIGEAMLFYTMDAGATYIQDEATGDLQNLAVLGAELDERAIYHPTTADPDARAYFGEAADGFIIVTLSASTRRCDLDDGACAIDGQDAAAYFTRTDGDGNADWLALAGGTGLPPHRIYHLPIATAEGVDYDAFYRKCAAYPNFPATLLDVMEPSEQNATFEPFVGALVDRGGAGKWVDLCEAMSSRGEATMLATAVDIRGMFR